MENLNRDLAEARDRLRQAEALRRRLRTVEGDLRAQRNRLEPLKLKMTLEAADVKRLEGLSLPALFYTLLGSKELQLQKERQEALAAKLRHDEASYAADALADLARQCREELEGLADAEVRYRQLLDEKEQQLKGRPDAAARLLELSNRVGGARADLRETEEAHAAGLKARRSLEIVVEQLQKAESWGAWDLWGGGAFATSMKHSHLNDARAEVHLAQHHLRRFDQELRDIGEPLEASLEMGAFTQFADWFFDGLLIDWVVQKRIQESLLAATKAAAQVSRRLQPLEKQLSDARSELARAEAERKDFLERA